MGTSAYFPKIRLIEESPTRWVFAPEGNNDAVTWIQILSGGALCAFICWDQFVDWNGYGVFKLIGPLYFAIMLIVMGLVRRKANRTWVSFDLSSKTCRLWTLTGGIRDSEEGDLLANLEDIQAVQFLQVKEWMFFDRKCHELNLVLQDADRVFVVGAKLPDQLLDDARRLAAFLGKPLLEASTQSGSGRNTFVASRPRRVPRSPSI